jgi:hypothetical protein
MERRNPCVGWRHEPGRPKLSCVGIPGSGGQGSRRRAERYRLQLQVELPGATGRTRDVSIAGVYFTTDQTYVVGDGIAFTLVFPEGGQAPPLRLRCQGAVVRVEPAGGEVGVAVRIDGYSIVPLE